MARPKAKKAQSVVVYWRDASFHMELKPIPEISRTYGEITFQNDDFIRIASEKFADGTFRSYTAIPVGMILKIVPMEHTEPPEFEPYDEEKEVM